VNCGILAGTEFVFLFVYILGRGPSIWDTFSQVPGNVKNNNTGNIGPDGYHHVLEDIKLLKSLKVK